MSGFRRGSAASAGAGDPHLEEAVLRARQAAAAVRLAGSATTAAPSATALAMVELAQRQRAEEVLAHRERSIRWLQEQAAAELMAEEAAAALVQQAVAPSSAIPIGFIRDPSGASWAASLQRPSSLAAEGHNPQQAIPLSSDEEEEDEEEQAQLQQLRVAARRRRARQTSSSAPKPAAAPTPPAVPREEMRRRHEIAVKAATRPSATAPSAPPVAAGPSPRLRQNTSAAARTSTSQVGHPNTHPPSKAATGNKVIGGDTRRSRYRQMLAGPYVQKFLINEPISEVTKAHITKAILNKILLHATGWTTETAPHPHFPPAEITMEYELLEQISQELCEEQYRAVGEAVRKTYTDMKSRHDEILNEEKQKAARAEATAASVVAKAREPKPKPLPPPPPPPQPPAPAPGISKKAMEKMEQELTKMRKERDAARNELELIKKNQKRTLSAYMAASVHSLRMVRQRQLRRHPEVVRVEDSSDEEQEKQSDQTHPAKKARIASPRGSQVSEHTAEATKANEVPKTKSDMPMMSNKELESKNVAPGAVMARSTVSATKAPSAEPTQQSPGGRRPSQTVEGSSVEPTTKGSTMKMETEKDAGSQKERQGASASSISAR